MINSDFMSDAEFDDWLKRNEGNIPRLVAFTASQQYKQSKTCDSMEKHLGEINGTVADLKEKQLIIMGNQANLKSRMWLALPNNIQKAIIVWLALMILSSLAIPIICALAVYMITD